MKAIRLTLLLILLSVSTLIGQSSFADAVAAQQDGDNSKAIQLYKQIESEGFRSKELYSNLARIYYDQNDNANARLYLERALRLDPNNQVYIKLIDELKERMTVTVSAIPSFIVVRVYRNIANKLSSRVWFIIQMLLGIGLLFLLYKYLLTAARGRNMLTSIISVFVLFIMTFNLSRTSSYIEYQERQAIIMTEEASLYEAADVRSNLVAPLGAGLKVYIIDELSDWYKVRLDDRDEGWIEKEKATII